MAKLVTDTTLSSMIVQPYVLHSLIVAADSCRF